MSNVLTVINPLTKRPIKIGGKVYKKLLTQGLLKDGYGDESKYVISDENLPPPLPLERQTAHATHFVEEEEEQETAPTPTKKTRKKRPYVRSNNVQERITDYAVQGIKKNLSTIQDLKPNADDFTEEDDDNLNRLIHQMIMDEIAQDGGSSGKYAVED